MNCPLCGCELEFKAKSGKYYCAGCEDTLSPEQIKQGSPPWPQAMAGDDSLWLPVSEADTSSYPPIISHEYLRLRKLLAGGQSFGALLQIKDLFEVLLKLPVLLEAARVFHNRQTSTEDNSLLVNLLEKPLSLGDWETAAVGLKKKASLPQARKVILDDLF